MTAIELIKVRHAELNNGVFAHEWDRPKLVDAARQLVDEGVLVEVGSRKFEIASVKEPDVDEVYAEAKRAAQAAHNRYVAADLAAIAAAREGDLDAILAADEAYNIACRESNAADEAELAARPPDLIAADNARKEAATKSRLAAERGDWGSMFGSHTNSEYED